MDNLTHAITLRWRQNGRDGGSNHQPCDCLLNRLLRRRLKKTSTLRVTGLCAGNSPVTGEFPAQMASNAENVSIWWRHHEFCLGWGLLELSSLISPLVFVKVPVKIFESQSCLIDVIADELRWHLCYSIGKLSLKIRWSQSLCCRQPSHSSWIYGQWSPASMDDLWVRCATLKCMFSSYVCWHFINSTIVHMRWYVTCKFDDM